MNETYLNDIKKNKKENKISTIEETEDEILINSLLNKKRYSSKPFKSLKLKKKFPKQKFFSVDKNEKINVNKQKIQEETKLQINENYKNKNELELNEEEKEDKNIEEFLYVYPNYNKNSQYEFLYNNFLAKIFLTDYSNSKENQRNLSRRFFAVADNFKFDLTVEDKYKSKKIFFNI